MGWLTKVIVLAAIQYVSPTAAAPHSFAATSDNDNFLESTGVFEEDNIDFKRLPPMPDAEEEKLDELGSFLAEMLLLPWNGRGLPLLYVENELSDDLYNGVNDDPRSYEQRPEISAAPYKRSRYYRKYPWKRQNSRQTYDAENRYLCQPSKDDVLRLLVALHEARQGTKGRTINFCNRKRPATAIFTNIRFLG